MVQTLVHWDQNAQAELERLQVEYNYLKDATEYSISLMEKRIEQVGILITETEMLNPKNIKKLKEERGRCKTAIITLRRFLNNGET